MTNPNIIKVIYGSENLGIGVITVWQDLKILDLEVTLVAEDEIRLPFFRENALRVGLGTSFRQTVCINNKQEACQGCVLEALCAYSKIFAASSYPYISFFAPDTLAMLTPGTPFKLNLRLFGPAVAYYPYFYFSLENLAGRGIGLRNSAGKRGRFILKEINAIAPDGQKTLIFTREDDARVQEARAFTLADYLEYRPVQFLQLKTLSPLRLKYQNHFATSLEFHILLRAALRRISHLYFLATGENLQLDYRGLVDAAIAVNQVENNLRWFDPPPICRTQS
ncbi:hypothetical protein MOTE_03600 [Moorella thermoacetica]|uniref:Uncharacterized protein n=1 Tax=Neomoorella thermoacetica TaxID=1525 RepID=A0A1J5P1B8_NEOTH|nr:hypothetical protein MOTE_03600 [Moorella thermoacetica]